MARMIYAATMALDGFIAGPGGDVTWLTGRPAVDEVIGRIGALLMGHRTFAGALPLPPGRPWFVLTRHAAQSPHPGVTFVDDFDTAVAAVRAAAGDGDVGVLGADVATQCLTAGLLDEVHVSVAPVLLGEGTRLFDLPVAGPLTLAPNVTITRRP